MTSIPLIPNEIIVNIILFLPQKYIFKICSTVCRSWNHLIFHPSMISTVYIYSEQQLLKLIQHAKEKKLPSVTKGNQPINYYIEQFIIFCEYEIQDRHIHGLSEFPNLRSINGTEVQQYPTMIYIRQPKYLNLNSSTHFFSEDYNEQQWIIKFNAIHKRYLKSLHIYINKYLLHFNPHQQQESSLSETIHFETVMYESFLNYTVKALVLPTSVIHLKDLTINFSHKLNSKLKVEETTFENIHQSCPLLESLSVENFILQTLINPNNKKNNISKDENNYKSADRLKIFSIQNTDCYSVHCFSYFSAKYPKLESLSFGLVHVSRYSNGKSIPIFQEGLIHMLLECFLLKKISFHLSTDNDRQKSNGYNLIHLPFMKWLYQHPNQLTHLEYPGGLILDKIQENEFFFSYSDIVERSTQPIFLIHLTQLSLNLDSTIRFVLIYLLKNKNIIMVSNVLEGLTIHPSPLERIKDTYIYDWLDLFPNLTVLNILHIVNIKDNSDYTNGIINEDNINFIKRKNEYCQNANKLHQLIKKRKQQYQDTSNKKNKHHNEYYKLKSLKIECGHLYFKYGFHELLKKCHQLKKLEIKDIVFMIYEATPLLANEIHFNLSHISLDLLHIEKLFYQHHSRLKSNLPIYKLTLFETISQSLRVIDDDYNVHRGTTKYSVFLKFKYIERLICHLCDTI